MPKPRTAPTREQLIHDAEWVTEEINKELEKPHPNRGRLLILRLSLDEHLRRLNALLDREEAQ